MPVRCSALLALMAMSVRAVAYEAVPFFTRNENPFIQVHGLPAMEEVRVIAPDTWATRVTLDISNDADFAESSSEYLVIDGETYRLGLNLRYGLGERTEVGIEIPYIRHDEGFLDSFVKSWHGLLGLSNGDRNDLPNNELHYQYQHDGRNLYNITGSVGGIGDVRITGGWRVFAEEGTHPRRLTLRVGAKLPSGKASKLTGSGAGDLTVDVSGSDARLFARHRGHLYGRVGLALLGGGDVLSELQRDYVWYGNVGFGRRVNKTWEFKVQLDAHSSVYNSGLDQLGADSYQFTLGGTALLGKKTYLDLGLVEDVTGDTSPDVIFHFALRRAYP